MLQQKRYERIKIGLDIFLALIGLIAVLIFFMILGFEIQEIHIKSVKYFVGFISVSFIFQEIFRWFLHSNKIKYIRERWFENILALVLFIDLIIPNSNMYYLLNHIPDITVYQATLIYLAIINFIILFAVIVKVLRYNYLISKIKLHPGAIFAISFATIILIGSVLLMFPNSTPGSSSLNFIDSLFTSTSAVCVTGLIVIDTARDFTFLGKAVILLLIQIGGLGVMTLTTFFAIFLSGGVSYKMRILMKDLLSHENLNEVGLLLKKILIYTFSIEIIGAVLLYISLGGNLIDIRLDLLWTSVFHSISAFCNAGFSIFSLNLMDNLVVNNYFFNSIIMALIVLGGLGFAVLTNLTLFHPLFYKKRRFVFRISITTKIVLLTTAFLIFGGALLIYLVEPFSFNPDLSAGEKWFHSLFLSITTRTAGFNTVPIEQLANVVVVIILPLMWIGASPGGTGGGIKTTTIAITMLGLMNLMRGKEKIEVFDREISQDTLRKAFMVLLASLIFLGIGSFLLIWVEPDKQPLDLIFEATSALGTVGLSRNITFFLGTGGKVIVIILMFIGRIGVLTFFLAFISSARQPRYTLPKTDIVVG